MLFLLLACTDPTALTDGPRPVSETTWAALVAPEYASHAGRAILARDGAVRFSDAGPVANVPTYEPSYEGSVDVVEADSGVRVVIDRSGVRLLMWLDRDDLEPVVAESVWIDGAGRTVADGGAGVYVRSGWIDVDEDGAHLALSWPLSGTVDVPDAFIDEWYTPGAAPADFEGPTAMVETATPVLDAHGNVLAVIEDTPAEVTVLERRGDQRLIGVEGGRCGGGTQVRGWVDAAALDEEPDYGIGRGYCCGFGFGDWGFGSYGGGGTTTLPPERLLWDAPDGDVVGVVLGYAGGHDDDGVEIVGGVTLRLDTDAGELPGWEAVIVPTRQGSLTVWAKQSDGDLDDLAPPDPA